MKSGIRAGFAKLAKGAGLKILSRRSSRVRIPYPALMLSVFGFNFLKFLLRETGFFFSRCFKDDRG
jgi:hypothetical protein